MADVGDVLIVGGGPSGLAAAIAAERKGLQYEVLEKGVLVNSIFNFPQHMVFFTTPELLEVGDVPFVSPYEKPTRVEALRYYRRIVDTFGLRVSLAERVTRIARQNGQDSSPFIVESDQVRTGRHQRRARSVVIAIGYYDNPNRLEVPGEDLPHVFHYYREPHGYYRKRVVVVGGKNSAAETALELFRAGASVTLVHRRSILSDSIKYWVKPDIENRINEGSIAARFETHVVEITPDSAIVSGPEGRETLPADAVFLMTGYRPDSDFLRSMGIEVDPITLVPSHDPKTLETNVRGIFLAGSIVSGREANKVFIENGRFHGESVIATIASRLSSTNAE